MTDTHLSRLIGVKNAKKSILGGNDFMDFETPGVNLIMVTYGQPEMCAENIERIMERTDYPDFSLTVIDNHSPDHAWQWICDELYKHGTKANGLQTHQNIGYGQGANLGALTTNKPLMVFMNSDVYPLEGHEDWLSILVDTLMESDDVAVVAPKLVKDGLIMGAGVVGTNKDRRIRGWQEVDTGQYDTVDEVISVCGAVYGVKREYFMQYGGFFVGYRHYFEEEDFSFTVRNDGLKVVYNGNSVMVHDHMGSCKDLNTLRSYSAVGQNIFMNRWQHVMNDPTEYPIPFNSE